MDRRKFIGVTAAATAFAAVAPTLGAVPSGEEAHSKKSQNGLKIRFLGTGAADWNGRDERGELRRLSSILVDNDFLIDFTATSKDMVPEGVTPDTIFYTHSHGDHYSPSAALELGISHVYVNQSWFDFAQSDFSNAAKELGKPMPEIIPLCIGTPVKKGDVTLTQLPANHASTHLLEQAVIYLVEKGGARLLYATDTGGIPAVSSRLAGIDAHIKGGKPVTGLIMEATMGMDYEVDYRLFTHSSVALVERTVKVLTMTDRYAPSEGQPVYLTHMARGLHGTQAQLDATLPSPLKAAYDGLEIIFK